jgi:glutamate/tyrosine decarboxylase-like PLP-dependent enzyme
VADVEQMLRKWQVQVTHPRYFGLFNPSVTLASIVADTLVAMYNPQLASWRTSPAANEIERHTLAWLAGQVRLTRQCHRDFHERRSGGQSLGRGCGFDASLSRIWRTRSARLWRPAPTLYLTGEAHHSFNKIAHITGLGRQALRIVETDRDLKMDVEALATRVAEDRRERSRTLYGRRYRWHHSGGRD